MKTSIIIADDNPLIRKGLQHIISPDSDLQIIGEAGDGAETIQKYIELNPDITILDISMPNINGVDAAKRILDVDDQAKIIFYSMINSRAEIKRAYKIGVKGFISKEKDADEIIQAIKKVDKGEMFFEDNVFYKGKNSFDQDTLTEREIEILELISKGKKNYEIGEKLLLSERTIEVHRKNLKDKIGISRHSELQSFAIEYFSSDN